MSSNNIFDLMLRNINGETYKINVSKNDNILNCRLKTASETCQPIENIRFLIDGKILDDNVTIEEYKLNEKNYCNVIVKEFTFH